jgi:hypothetical protein
MPKRIEISDRIAARIRASGAEDVDLATVAVFEAAALNTRPLRKKGSIYENATVDANTLRSMAQYLQKPGNSVPLHTLHMQGMELPVGRVFYGETVVANDGAVELRTLFYVPTSEEDIVQKIEADTLTEVSVGVVFEHLFCSECGFDYMEADFESLYTRTCANGHTIGENGVHIVSSGLDAFMELSLVSKGAAQDAKIVGRNKSLLAARPVQRLAASKTPELLMLHASATQEEPSMPETTVTFDLNALIAENVETKTKLSTVEAALAAAQATITELTAKLEASNGQVGDLTTKLNAANTTDADALKTATDFIKSQTKLVLTATGKADSALPETLAEQISTITTVQASLAGLTQGRALPSDAGSGDASKGHLPASAFKTRK